MLRLPARLARTQLSRASRQLSTASSAPLTKLVSTIGPASEEAEPLAGCVAAGMNVMRVNFSHATKDEFHLRRTNLRAAPGGEYVAVMLDTKGPEIRMGGLKVCKETGNRKAKMKLTTGQTLTLTNDKAFDGAGDERTIYVDYPRLAEVVEPGTTVLLDDGLISLEVVSAADGKVTTTVLNSSEIGERKGVNIPGVVTGLPAMSDKDLEDISFGIEHDIDMVAASFVRNAAGVHQIREHILKCHEKYAANGGMDTPPPMIISKIESTEALDNLAEIIEASDGIMVARGDLGVEVPLEKVTWQTEPEPRDCARDCMQVEVPLEKVVTWQKDIVAMTLAAGKPVVVATQMLETMQKNPRPTRAEVADVTNAVLDGADAVMLSGESANGLYPTESVAMQARIVAEAEAWASARGLAPGGVEPQLTPVSRSMPGSISATESDFDEDDQEEEEMYRRELTIPDSMSAAACFLAARVGARAIVVFEDGWGETARNVSKFRPTVPIAALCDSLKVCRQLSISRGVVPLLVEPQPEIAGDPSEGEDEFRNDMFSLDTLDASDACSLVAERTGLLEPGDLAIVLVGETISVEVVMEPMEWEGDEAESKP